MTRTKGLVLAIVAALIIWFVYQAGKAFDSVQQGMTQKYSNIR